jgi:hypothetical protein
MERKLYKDMIAVTSPLRNFSALRAVMRAELERRCSTGAQGVSGIPFTGLFLNDLVFTLEQPNDLGKQQCAPKCWAASEHAKDASPLILPVVNYNKYRAIAGILTHFRDWQKARATISATQSSSVVPEIYASCVCLRTVTETELEKLSHQCENPK